MMTFAYQARDTQGKTVSGDCEAVNEDNAITTLMTRGLMVLSIEQRAVKKTAARAGKVGDTDLVLFTRQLATMVDAGLPLLTALAALYEQADPKKQAGLKFIVGEIMARVQQGDTFNEAISKHPKVFSRLYISMIKAGETGGMIAEILDRLAGFLESNARLVKKVKSAMTYPVVVFCMAILAVVGMLIFVVPTFAAMFQNLGGELPLPTQILVAMSNGLKTGGPVLLVLCVIGYIVWHRVKHTEKVRGFLDPLKLKLPVFGGLFQKIAISRFTRNLGTMISSGVPILQSLDIVADTTGNVVVREAVRDIQTSVRNGESLSAPLANHKVFPAMVVQMMAVGEDTGALDTMLHKISDFYDQEVESTADALASLIEPLMIAFLGGIIGAMIIALYMPIFKIFDLIK